ncbi:hypothetical protein [Halorussus caseinilyticus]|uniref:hypothetical protein n=1 Tax=Halorussus caseinilyticus TaxID=3034025 RepID=UPI0023E7A98D|nr:hypothetical protein [Halorussus sp. DT72]
MNQSARLFLVAVILVAPATAVATGAVGGGFDRPVGNETYGLGNETAVLWSLDTDTTASNVSNDTTVSNTTAAGNQSMVEAMVNATDYTWSQSPDLPRRWNRRAWAALARNFSTTRSRSVAPSNASRESVSVAGTDGGVRDAHATVARIQPATHVFVDGATRRTMLARDGRVFGLVDYRVEPPADDTDASDGRTVEWTVASHEIAAVCVLQGVAESRASCDRPGSRIGRSAGGHVVNVSYEALGYGGRNTTLVLAARIDVEYVKTVRERHSETYEECREVRTPAGTVTKCDEETRTWWTETTTRPTQEVVVTDSMSGVSFYRLRSAVRYARYPDGDMGVVVQSSHRWTGVNVSGQGVVPTRWRFYTARNPAWDEFQTATSEGVTRRHSGVRPVRTYAFPADVHPRGYSDTDTGSGVVVEAVLDGETAGSPAGLLPDAVDVDVVAGEYETTRTLAVRADEFTPTVRVRGLVGGVESEVVNLSATTGVRRVRRSNLSAAVVESNATHATVRVELRGNATGRPIDLRDRDGHVVVAGHRVNTNASGVVLVSVEKAPSVGVRYRPAPWWSETPAFTGSRVRVHPGSRFFSIQVQAELWTRILGFLTPVVFVLYLVGQLPGAQTWPPWSRRR